MKTLRTITLTIIYVLLCCLFGWLIYQNTQSKHPDNKDTIKQEATTMVEAMQKVQQ